MNHRGRTPGEKTTWGEKGLSDDSQGEEETTAAIYKLRRSRAQKEAILATGRLICAAEMNADSSSQGGTVNSSMHAAGRGATMGPRQQVQVRKPRKSTKGVDNKTTAVLKSNGSADKPSEIEIKALQGVLKEYGLKKMPTVKSTHNAVNKRRTMEARVNEMKEERKWKVGGKREWYD